MCSSTTVRPHKLIKLGLGPDAPAGTRQAASHLCGDPRLAGGRPLWGRPAYDDIIQGYAGVAGGGTLTGEPRYMPTIVADKTCGLMASQAILAALFHRQNTDAGRWWKSMFETMVSYLIVEHLYQRDLRAAHERMGYARVLAPWQRPYRTADGRICMLAYTDQQWRRFLAGGRPARHDGRPRFTDLAARTRHIDDVYRLAGKRCSPGPAGEWLELLDARNSRRTPSTRLPTSRQSHLAAISFFRQVSHPPSEIVMADIPLRFSDSPAEIQPPARRASASTARRFSAGAPACRARTSTRWRRRVRWCCRREVELDRFTKPMIRSYFFAACALCVRRFVPRGT